MKIIEKFKAKQENIKEVRQPTIAFIGDSVTHGCFELYVENGEIETYVKQGAAYHNKVKEIFGLLYPEVPVTIINAGISGDEAYRGAQRLDRDVLSYNPDLVVVCYGLNDANAKDAGLERYEKALDEMFENVLKTGAEVIFLTPNLRSCEFDIPTNMAPIDDAWKQTTQNEKEGWLDSYLEKAKKLCQSKNIPVCDCNNIWKILRDNDVNINNLLSNRINHPIEELHYVFAYELVKIMFSK